MRKYATGVAVLTVRSRDEIHGMTANSFTSVSLDPVLVLVCILNGSTTHELVTRAGHYAMNFLSQAQSDWAKRFAKQVLVPADPFYDIEYHTAVTGAPIFNNCLGYVDCEVVAAHPAGDHTIFVGQVLAVGYGQAKEGPLVWFGGGYKSLLESKE
jgi:flavin reductase (DIM6/NTAB) family NADH-FMN oxidoreductase RutF